VVLELVRLEVVRLERRLERPEARRISDKTVHLLPHRSLRKRPFIHPVRITVTEVRRLGKTLRVFTGLYF
jgi:hypothetical protein